VSTASSRRLERLVNLTVTLMDARRPVTVAQLASTVYGVEDPLDDAFRRMFERDKEALREQGIPLTTEGLGGHDDEVGYRIPPQDYRLPDIDLAPDEAAALALAARLWSSASLAEDAGSALRKLEAAGVDVDPDRAVTFEPRLDGSGPVFDTLYAAAAARRAVTFTYRPGRTRPETQRTLEPWGLVTWRGRWYVVGHDRDRDEQRTFRLSRVVGEVTPFGPAGSYDRPAGTDLRKQLSWLSDGRPDGPEGPLSTATVRVAPGRAWSVRRAAREVTEAADGSATLTLTYSDPRSLAGWLVSFGPDLTVLEPPELVEETVSRLRAVLEPAQVAG
jgi:proteasome accessory factor B